MLDPACGSGNFLYLALQALKDLEHRVQLEAEALGFQRAFPEIGPTNVKGIEINPYAAELARVSVWIGEIPKQAVVVETPTEIRRGRAASCASPWLGPITRHYGTLDPFRRRPSLCPRRHASRACW